MHNSKNNTCVKFGRKSGLMCDFWNEKDYNVWNLERFLTECVVFGTVSYQFSHIVANFDFTKKALIAK